MNKTIFDFYDYKAYLQYKVQRLPYGGRGFWSQLARHLNCQSTFISQVINKSADLSLEQAEKANEILSHNEGESRYFVFMVGYSRAGTKNLREHYRGLMVEEIEKQVHFQKRFKVKDTLSEYDKSVFYSQHIYAAIQILCTIPVYQDAQALAQALHLPLLHIRKCIDYLLNVGLITEEKGRLKVGVNRIHLGKDSPFIHHHHTNWRLFALKNLEAPKKEPLRYTSIVSLSEADAQKLKRFFTDNIEQFNKTVESSPAEKAFCLNLDFFEIT